MNSPFNIETTTIGLMLWNPTNEDFDMQYAGISISLKAGQKQSFAMKCATHLLNGFGQRGLTSLTYGCDEEKVGREAIQRNLDFKKKQVIEYNQRNENRKHMGLGYLPPTNHVKKYAIELGISLLEPYSMKDAERSEISKLATENSELKAQMAQLLEKVNAMFAKKEEVVTPQPELQEPEPEPDPEPAVQPEKVEEARPRGNPNWFRKRKPE